eukprot:jgi/Botrbrau1/19450/Bobra.0338s0071.1
MVAAVLPRFTVTHIPGTRSSRVVLLLEELGLPYTIKDRAAGKADTHPLRKVPALEVFEEDTDGPTFTLFESGAIVQYLLDTQDHENVIWVPKKEDRAAYSNYLRWFWFSECELMEPLAQYYRHTRAWPEAMRLPEVAEYSRKRVVAAMHAVEAELEKSDYITGPTYSGADVMLGGAVRGALGLRISNGEDHPNAAAYLSRIAKRPAFSKAYPPRMPSKS